MNYLVDTQILLWSFLETSKLSKNVKLILENENNKIFYSPISLWEISIKYGLKKLFLNGGTPEDFFLELKNSYYLSKFIDPELFITIYRLPSYHKDPFDRYLIWEAINNDLTLISTDEKMSLYEKDGLKFICR
ncbi:MAG: type II toxin-antitoxin system VapC family toxin [Treponema sp.]|nr:type II toxin-antitoxin system VapC family toxin [Treponema sp.]